ncbi:hypothetical protein G7Y89_g9111 [Cudoniella acicularis]|uniref:Protein kinase domain-containing protein n=1 Tax=Cudoniella acicularis TaxID=354080 RepID=A0A8H4W2X2_9HELO|nr:hypothetical protein G7Y89_g9111 [Cudoniella acicularis]
MDSTHQLEKRTQVQPEHLGVGCVLRLPPAPGIGFVECQNQTCKYLLEYDRYPYCGLKEGTYGHPVLVLHILLPPSGETKIDSETKVLICPITGFGNNPFAERLRNTSTSTAQAGKVILFFRTRKDASVIHENNKILYFLEAHEDQSMIPEDKIAKRLMDKSCWLMIEHWYEFPIKSLLNFHSGPDSKPCDVRLTEKSYLELMDKLKVKRDPNYEYWIPTSVLENGRDLSNIHEDLPQGESGSNISRSSSQLMNMRTDSAPSASATEQEEIVQDTEFPGNAPHPNNFFSRIRECYVTIMAIENDYLFNLHALRLLSNPLHASSYSNIIRIRLQPYERILLADIVNVLSSGNSKAKPDCDEKAAETANHVATLLFFRWSWADSVLRHILGEFSPDNVVEAHGGDHEEAFAAYRTQLRTRVRDDIYDRRYHRTEQLVADNSELFSRVDQFADINITVAPHVHDIQLWIALGNCVTACLASLTSFRRWPGFCEIAELLGSWRDMDAASFTEGLQAAISMKIATTPDFPPRTIPLIPSEEAAVADNFKLRDLRPEMPVNEKQKRVNRWASDSVQLIFEAEDVWDAWILSRMVQTLVYNMVNIDEFKSIVQSQAFSPHWKVVENDRDESLVSWAVHPVEQFGGILNERLSTVSGGFIEEDLQEYMDLAYRRHYHNLPLLDPRVFLEFIPWNQLADCSTDAISDLLEDLGLDASIFTGILCKASVTKAISPSRIFYASDDLYAPHVTTAYHYPGLLKDGKIIYWCRKLEDTEFLKDLRHYWTIWVSETIYCEIYSNMIYENDCAITRNPFDSSLYVLETLPGIKARMLEQRSDIGSVLDFFDVKYRYRETFSVQREMLRNILGTEYDSSYTDFLLYIKPDEFDLPQCSFVGAGSFGRVYHARWSKKPVKQFDHVEELPGDVVLKIALAQEGPAKFFSELGTVYAALAGDNSGCVKFYGFTQVFVDQTGKPIQVDHITATPAYLAYALVFDYASKGHVLDVLDEELEPGAPVENWLTICDVLSEIAEGLRTIHKKNVIHRDLHENNVLVQEEQVPDCDEIECVTLISDLGEGKDMAKLSTYKATEIPAVPGFFSIEDSLAPEVAARGSSKESDIYAWAVLAVKIISKCYTRLADEDGKVYYPAKLMRVLEQCLDPNPNIRFDAVSLCYVVEEIREGPSGLRGGGDDTEWFDESYELPGARVGVLGRLPTFSES